MSGCAELTSAQRMDSIRDTHVPANAIALWFVGQNGFLLKSAAGTVVAIDPYLTDSCAAKYKHLGLDLGRQVPVPIQPEDLTVDFVVLTHSHDDHLDEETIRRLTCSPEFLAPWSALQKLHSIGIAEAQCRLLHPQEEITLGDIRVEGTFALPTDGTDLNHIGLLFTFFNGIRMYNTGDTAYADILKTLLPSSVDICAICINGGFHNLDAEEAARIAMAVDPQVVVPTHYDVMLATADAPESFRAALDRVGFQGRYHQMDYDHPLLYTRPAR